MMLQMFHNLAQPRKLGKKLLSNSDEKCLLLKDTPDQVFRSNARDSNGSSQQTASCDENAPAKNVLKLDPVLISSTTEFV